MFSGNICPSHNTSKECSIHVSVSDLPQNFLTTYKRNHISTHTTPRQLPSPYHPYALSHPHSELLPIPLLSLASTDPFQQILRDETAPA
ncbi:hypothetical protein CDAR_57511 [Caerostris darwini]|uniref:Uncharacterized protein n=1 Tax=Caerostris darwini TaxID=1538125 RepID=A0AAV4SY32_9ARAC|nr:hypothetical protein CDAR_57511 [Caerostris darwini]